MESLRYVFVVIQPNSWMVSADLKDPFYNISFNTENQKCFKFKGVLR